MATYNPELLTQPFIPLDKVTGGETYNSADNKTRLSMFDSWSGYAKDYLNKQFEEAPEDKKPTIEGNIKELESFISERKNHLQDKYDLSTRVTNLMQNNDSNGPLLDAFRDPNKMIEQGFAPEEVMAVRKSIEDELAPALARAKQGPLLQTVSENVPFAKNWYADALEKAKKQIWEEPGVLDQIHDFNTKTIPYLLGQTLVKGAGGALGVLDTAAKYLDYTGSYEDKNPIREASDKLMSLGDQIAGGQNSAFPMDPRYGKWQAAVTSGAVQMPGQLALMAVPGAGPALGMASNVGQMFAENLGDYQQDIARSMWKQGIDSGTISKGTPFSTWEKSLSDKDRENIRSKAAGAAAGWAMGQGFIENKVNETLLKDVGMSMLPDSAKKALMRMRYASPKSYMAARILTNAGLKSSMEGTEEVAQEGMKNIGSMVLTGDYSLDNLTKNFGTSFVGGLAGGGAATGLTINNTYKTEKAIDWAKSILEGKNEAIQKDLDIIDPVSRGGLRQVSTEVEAPTSVSEKEREDAKKRLTGLSNVDLQHQLDLRTLSDPSADKSSLDYRDAATRQQRRTDEANWTLKQVGEEHFDETSADRFEKAMGVQRKFDNALAEHIYKNNTPLTDIFNDATQKLGELKDRVAGLRKQFQENGDSTGGMLESGLDAFEKNGAQNILREAQEKSKGTQKAIDDFIGSMDEDGPGRADYARSVLSTSHPNSVFSDWFNDDAAVTEALNAKERGEIDENTNLDEWLKSPAIQAKQVEKTGEEPAKPQGLMTTGQRLDALRMAEDNLSDADEPTRKEFGRLKEDIQFWNSILTDKESNEQDKAEAQQRLPALENTLLDLATVSSQSTNPNDQNQTENQAPLPNQEIPTGGAASEGAGTGPTIRVKTMGGEEVDQTQEDYAAESRGIVKALESGEMSGNEALQNVEAVRQEIEAAPELSPEQKQEWFSAFENIPLLVQQRSGQEPQTAAPTEQQQQPEPVATAAQPTPARMGGMSGDVSRSETGEVVFKPSDGSPETVLRVKEASVEKDPATLTVDDFEGGDGTPLVSEADKQFSVLPQNERLVRPFFRSEQQQAQSQDGQTAKSSGSYPEAAGSTPAPATPAPDIQAIAADVQANPDQHRSKQGNRKLVSREAAVTILSQLPETLTNKDVATIAKDSGMTSANFRKLAAMRGNAESVGSILNGGMDAELGLFDRSAAPAQTTAPTAKVSNDTRAASNISDQAPVARWMDTALATIEEEVGKLSQSKLNAAPIREMLSTEEGRNKVREKLGQMFNTVSRNLKISDPVMRDEALEKIFYGNKSQTGEGLTVNVIGDLMENLRKTGDPFVSKSKGGEVSYSAWFRHRNKQAEFIDKQNTRDMTGKEVEVMGEGSTSSSQAIQEEQGDTDTSFGEADADLEEGRAEAKRMQREAVSRTYDNIITHWTGRLGLDRDTVRAAVANHFAKKVGTKMDFDGLGWATPTPRQQEKAAATLAPYMDQIGQELIAGLTKSVKAATQNAMKMGLLKSGPVEVSENPTLEQLLELGAVDELRNADFHGAIKEAKEKQSVEPLKPLLSQISRDDIRGVQSVVGAVLNNGKPSTDARQLTSFTKADMQKVLDSGLLPTRIKQTLQTLVDLSGNDGLDLVRKSKSEGFRRLADIYSEQIGKGAPVEVVFNLALNPETVAQGLWNPGENKIHISPFLTREPGLMEATILHETMHPVWDRKITSFVNGNFSNLNSKELDAANELQRLYNIAKAEAATRLDAAASPEERSKLERDFQGTNDLREFLNEALNHKPFQDFLNELKDPEHKGKDSLLRRVLNKILELIRGGNVALDSVLQKAFESSVDLIGKSPKTPFLENLSSELAVSSPVVAETRAQADAIAANTLSDSELASYNYQRQMEGKSVLSSDAYEFVSPNDLEETLDLNGAIKELGSPRQAQLRDFSGRVHETFGMQGSTVTDAIGDWADGAEPTTVTEHYDPNLSYEDIKVMAALKGALRNQKGVIPFKVDDNGQQFLYDFFIPGKTISEAREIVDGAGIKFRTLIEQNGGTRVLIFDEDGSIQEAFDDLITKNKYEAKYLKGTGGLLGSWDSREEGREIYTRTVAQAIERVGSAGRDQRPDSPESIRAARLRSLAAEAGLKLDPAPELSVIEALTGQPPTQDEINRIAKSQPVSRGGTSVSPTSERMEAGRPNIQVPRPNAEPNPFVKEGVRSYNSRFGLGDVIEGHYAPVNEQRARDIASAYEALPVFDESPETQEAYSQLAKEIQQQWDFAEKEMGVVFEAWTNEGQPYANSREMVRDVRDNKHLWFFIGGEPHPLLNKPDANGLTMNDKLRAIHDLFGHAAEDFQFGARGEENAWIKHSQMFSPVAQKALTTETRGQNSWVNFGPQNYNEDGSSKAIPASDRPFAAQKVALLPEPFMDWKGALNETPRFSRSVAPDSLGKLWTNAVAKEGPSAFTYGEVSPETKGFSEVLGSVMGAHAKNYKVDYYQDGEESTEKEWEKAASENRLTEIWVTDPDGGKTVFFTQGASALSGVYAVNSAGTKLGGSPLYQAFYAWAHNNGKIVGPDSSLSRIAQLRRTSQMLSSALRFGTTQHMKPSFEQGLTGWRNVEVDENGAAWEITIRRGNAGTVDGLAKNSYNNFHQDVALPYFRGAQSAVWNGYEVFAIPISPEEAKQAWAENIGLLAKKEADLVFERIPSLSGLNISKDGYLFGPDKEYPGSTRALPAGNPEQYLGTLFSSILEADPEFAQRIGRATLARALATRFAETNFSLPALRQANAEGSESGELGTFSPFTNTLYSAPVVSKTPSGFTPSLFPQNSRRETEALSRVRSAPEYEGIRNALLGRTYISYKVDETVAQARNYIDAVQDPELAFRKVDNDPVVPIEQAVAVKGLALQSIQQAANEALKKAADSSIPVSVRNNMAFLADHYQNLANNLSQSVLETASLAGQELRAYRMLSDILTPQSWVQKYKAAATKTQKVKMGRDPVFKEAVKSLVQARSDAANSTAKRMETAISTASKKLLQGIPKEEVAAHEEFERQVYSELPVREAVMRAAADMAVVSGMEAVKDSLGDKAKSNPAFLKVWETRLRQIAGEQLNNIINDRLQGGKVDSVPEQKQKEQGTLDAWRQFSDFPLAEMVFNMARESVIASGSPFAGLVAKAKFDNEKISRLHKAVKMTVNLTEEIRKSVGEKNATLESLKLRLQEANPTLQPSQLDSLSKAVEAVYNEEVQSASRAALARVSKAYGKKAERVAGAPAVEKLLPLVNMGAFKEEEVYNALADRFGLPSWSEENAQAIQRMAEEVQTYPVDSLQRAEAGQRLMLEILRANIKDAKGPSKWQHLNHLASALWTASVLSGPQTQMVNISSTAVSVFLNSMAEATGHFIEAKQRGVSTEQALEFYKDVARAWVFAFGKDASNTSVRALNEINSAMKRGTSKFKSEKQEDLSPLELFKFDPKMAIPGNALMDALATGAWKEAGEEGVNLGLGILKTAADRAVNLDAKGAVKDILATSKMVGRFMLAADSANSLVATKTKQLMVKRALMQQEGMTEGEVNKAIRGMSEGGIQDAVDEAKAVADEESLKGNFGTPGSSEHDLAYARRVEELVEQNTYGKNLIEQGRNFAGEATFNGDPSGLIGAMMMTMFGGLNRIGGMAVKPINPFPKTLSNLINNAFDYTLYGSLRAEGMNLGSKLLDENSVYRKTAPEKGTAEYYSAHAKALAGSAFLFTLAGLLMQAFSDRKEKKEPFFEVHGPGPINPKERKQWIQSGNRPFSVRIGRTQFNYNDWPGVNIALGVLGSVYDQIIYSNDQVSPVDRLFTGVASVLGTTLNRNMLGGASSLMDILSNSSNAATVQAALKKLASSYIGGFSKPSFLRYLETISSGGYQDTSSLSGWLKSQVPFVGAIAGKPALNILGEPIQVTPWESTAGRLVSLSKTHPILSPLTNAGLDVPQPQHYQVLDRSEKNGFRAMTADEFYEFSKKYGENIRERLTPAQVNSFVAMSKVNPQAAQDALNNLGLSVRNITQAEMRMMRAPEFLRKIAKNKASLGQ